MKLNLIIQMRDLKKSYIRNVKVKGGYVKINQLNALKVFFHAFKYKKHFYTEQNVQGTNAKKKVTVEN